MRSAARLVAIALPLNFAWEMLQMPAFTRPPESLIVAAASCAVATLGDGALVVAVFGVVAMVLTDRRWFTRPGPDVTPWPLSSASC